MSIGQCLYNMLFLEFMGGWISIIVRPGSIGLMIIVAVITAAACIICGVWSCGSRTDWGTGKRRSIGIWAKLIWRRHRIIVARDWHSDPGHNWLWSGFWFIWYRLGVAKCRSSIESGWSAHQDSASSSRAIFFFCANIIIWPFVAIFGHNSLWNILRKPIGCRFTRLPSFIEE